MNYIKKGTELLLRAGITVNGSNPWDIQIHNTNVFKRVFLGGSVAAGESYMDGWWDVDDLTTFFEKIDKANVDDDFTHSGVMVPIIKASILNLQTISRAWQVGKEHYDIGNDLYTAMLDSRMTYSCGYWKYARTLEDAQVAKLDLICKKLDLKKGQRILDVGCGWGSFMQFAVENYGVEAVGLTISKEQAKLVSECVDGLPIEIHVQDYRTFNAEPFDHIISVGMFEHVGPKNYKVFMKKMYSLLKDDGLFLLHTIGAASTTHMPDPWIDKYIFPNGRLPSVVQIGSATNGVFIMEDWHNFGYDYSKTLDVWQENFDRAWSELEKDDKYNKRFKRMWKYYLSSTSGLFRTRNMQLWQIVFSKNGVEGGYYSVR